MTEGQKSALSQAGKMLSMRMMTKKQVLDKLAEKGFCEEDADFAVENLERMNAIDDLNYACQYVAGRTARGYGPVRIRMELRQRGIDDEDIESAFEELPDATDTIERFIVSRARQIPLDRSDASRISDALARRGFLWEDISPILRRYTEDQY
ncbi:MAG: regulatory protein RecX [Clostridiales bacterium]|jgi:regulatory protein|nr:regulatory protein RecX [Clostridiales bacterium]